ncbi:MAG: metallophosphoesterase [Candidatus Omnitrophica bacterium]|nr:metallophosphoesterase [Candidatus Omnitrophota bacterium]MCM8770338.1 metallophosphoesterase [Candidatus Omnitrophota bacterium]
MRIGIISDSHDNLPKIEAAVDFFKREKVDFVLHAGDFIAPFTIPLFNKLTCDFLGVFGNNDGEKAGLLQASGGRIKEGPFRLTLDGRSILLVHDIKQIEIQKENSAIIIFGHTHKPEVKKENSKLLINPGESCGWLSQRSTVAVLNLTDLAHSLIEI